MRLTVTRGVVIAALLLWFLIMFGTASTMGFFGNMFEGFFGDMFGSAVESFGAGPGTGSAIRATPTVRR